jgi:hypothetical protein
MEVVLIISTQTVFFAKHVHLVQNIRPLSALLLQMQFVLIVIHADQGRSNLDVVGRLLGRASIVM